MLPRSQHIYRQHTDCHIIQYECPLYEECSSAEGGYSDADQHPREVEKQDNQCWHAFKSLFDWHVYHQEQDRRCQGRVKIVAIEDLQSRANECIEHHPRDQQCIAIAQEGQQDERSKGGTQRIERVPKDANNPGCKGRYHDANTSDPPTQAIGKAERGAYVQLHYL